MAAAGWMVITGAGGGIMAAGHGGAGADPSFGLAIRLPFEQTTNVHIANDPKLINFKYFFTRKLMFLRSSHAVVALPRRVRHDGRRVRGAHARADRQEPCRCRSSSSIAPAATSGTRGRTTSKNHLLKRRLDQRARPAPLQDHRQRRRGRARGAALLQQLPQHPLRARRRSSSACTASRPTRSSRRSTKKFADIKVKGDVPRQRAAAGRARRAGAGAPAPAGLRLQPPRPRAAADADQSPERSEVNDDDATLVEIGATRRQRWCWSSCR